MRNCSGEARVTALISVLGAVLLAAGSSWAGPVEIIGEDTVGCYDQGIDGAPPSNSVFYVSNSNRAARVTANWLAFGDPSTTYVAAPGNFGGGGVTGPGLYYVDGSDGVWIGRNTYTGGEAPDFSAALAIEATYQGAGPAPTPLVGFFKDASTIGVAHYYPATGIFQFSDTPGGANTTAAIEFGPKGNGIRPVVGDWDGDGVDTVGVYDPATGVAYLTNGNTTANVNSSVIAFAYGAPGTGLEPVAGDWDNSGDGDTIGVFEAASNLFRLRNSNDAGTADVKPIVGTSSTCSPVVGTWGLELP